jgi:hypothetical protein
MPDVVPELINFLVQFVFFILNSNNMFHCSPVSDLLAGK